MATPGSTLLRGGGALALYISPTLLGTSTPHRRAPPVPGRPTTPPGFHVSSIRWPLPRRLLLAFPTGHTGVERTNTAHLQSVGSTCLSQQLASNTPKIGEENSSARVCGDARAAARQPCPHREAGGATAASRADNPEPRAEGDRVFVHVDGLLCNLCGSDLPSAPREGGGHVGIHETHHPGGETARGKWMAHV